MNTASTLTIKTTWGDIRIAARDGRIISCELPSFQGLEKGAGKTSNPWKKGDARPETTFAFRGGTFRDADDTFDKKVLRDAENFVKSLFAGRAAKVPPVAMPAAPEFTQAVWCDLQKIPFGKTRTYGEVAAAVHRPRAARAAGSACGANRIPLFIPCHRVLGSGGALGGFSSGLAWKKLLLACEGTAP